MPSLQNNTWSLIVGADKTVIKVRDVAVQSWQIRMLIKFYIRLFDWDESRVK